MKNKGNLVSPSSIVSESNSTIAKRQSTNLKIKQLKQRKYKLRKKNKMKDIEKNDDVETTETIEETKQE